MMYVIAFCGWVVTRFFQLVQPKKHIMNWCFENLHIHVALGLPGTVSVEFPNLLSFLMAFSSISLP